MKDWDEFFLEKRRHFVVITEGDEEAIACLKAVYEEAGERPVLSALEAFDALGFFGKKIVALWKICDNSPSEFVKAIINFYAGKITIKDFRQHVAQSIPFEGLVPVEELPPELLEPTIL